MQKLLKIAVGAFALLAVVMAAEGNVFGYLTRTVQLSVQSGSDVSTSGQEPSDVIAVAQRVQTDKTTFLAIGDIADCGTKGFISRNLATLQSWAGMSPKINPANAGASEIAALTRAWPTAPILAIGDLVYDRGTPHQFADCFDPIWGDLRDRSMPAPGNHEYRTPGAYPYYDYWGSQAGPDRRGYYFVRSGNWLILSLNSEIDSGPGSDQSLWLDDVLSAASEPCVLAVFHRPAYSLQSRDGTENAQALFAQLHTAGATLVVNGHNHFYERTHPLDQAGQIAEDTGTVSFVVGTGGASVSHVKELRDTTASAVFGELGILRLELGVDTFSWWFHAVGTAEVRDQGSRSCNSGRTNVSL